MTKFIIAIEDDWEIRGDCSGSIVDLQYTPALKFMDMAESLEIPISFMVEAMQRDFYLLNEKENNYLHKERKLWENSVKLMSRRGHDVQLHIHPQFSKVKLNNNKLVFNEGVRSISGYHENIGNYSKREISKMIISSKQMLENLVSHNNETFNINVFKAGHWSMQPSRNLFEILEKNNFKLVLGPSYNFYSNHAGFDYREMEEASLPYYPDYSDLNKISRNPSKLCIIPLQKTNNRIKQALRLISHNLRRKYNSSKYVNKYESVPSSKPIDEIFLGLFRTLFSSHLRIGSQSFEYMKASFDNVISKFSSISCPDIVPIVIESHTKDFRGNYAEIYKFLKYISSRKDIDIQFKKISDVANSLGDTLSVRYDQ